VRKHWKLIWRVLPYLRPYKRYAAGSVVLTIAAAVVALAEPWPLAFLIDGVLGGDDRHKSHALPDFVTSHFGTKPSTLILVAVLAGLLLAVLINGIAVLTEYVNTKLSLRMILRFRSDLVENALHQSIAFHDARSMGDFIARINYESSSVGAITTALPPLAQSVLTLGGMAYITYRIDSELALLALIVVPFIYYSTGYYGRNIEPRLRTVRGLEGGSLRIVYEAMSMLRVIAVFNREKYEHSRFYNQALEGVHARTRLTVRQSLFSFAVNVITAGGTALVLGVGAHHVLDGTLSVGEVLVLLSYVHAVYTPLQAISHSMASFQEQFIYFAMSLELLDHEPDIRDAPDAIELPSVRGAVEFENVDFAYKDRSQTLYDISFKVDPGEAIAIVGPTGAGKTTLMSLLSRLSEPNSGRVLIDGIDVRDVTLASLRQQISVVLQEPHVFTGTVGENIRYGNLDATQDEVAEAAIAANAHDFIMRLPNQYDTLLGENGTALSGGEKQRLCVARAFLKNAPILILDEPTSSIDSRTEAAILDALEKLMEGRTTFMIAHRLSTLRSVDRILVLDLGHLIEEGTHLELMNAGGLYRTLHDVQARQRDRYHEEPEALHVSTPTPLTAVLEELRARLRVLDRERGPFDTRPMRPERHVAGFRDATISAKPNPLVLAGHTAGVVEIAWSSVGYRRTEVRVGGPDGQLFAVSEQDPDVPEARVETTGNWVTHGTKFFLQDVSNSQPLTSENTLAVVEVSVLWELSPEPEPDPDPARDSIDLTPASAVRS
jgi:ATP-binding cassette, subfamily B, bacterial